MGEEEYLSMTNEELLKYWFGDREVEGEASQSQPAGGPGEEVETEGQTHSGSCPEMDEQVQQILVQLEREEERQRHVYREQQRRGKAPAGGSEKGVREDGDGTGADERLQELDGDKEMEEDPRVWAQPDSFGDTQLRSLRHLGEESGSGSDSDSGPGGEGGDSEESGGDGGERRRKRPASDSEDALDFSEGEDEELNQYLCDDVSARVKKALFREQHGDFLRELEGRLCPRAPWEHVASLHHVS